MESADQAPSKLSIVWEIVKTVVISLAIVIPIRVWIAQPFVVRGASMEPNFGPGEYLIIDEISPRISSLKRGEIIVFRFPLKPSQFFIKRIIGLPGESVVIKDGDVIITNNEYPDGFVLEENYLPSNVMTTAYPGSDTNFTLGQDEYFVLGDNRSYSSDSRIWGSLDKDLVIGRTFARLWPLDKIGFVR